MSYEPSDLRGTDAASAGEETRTYDRPRLVPIGNLRDLLAGTGTQNSDFGGCQDNAPDHDDLCP
jgi:hypothetical protein